MKKLVYSLAVLFSVALVSCGGNKAEDKDSVADSTVDSTVLVESDTTVVVADSAAPVADSAAADSAK